MDLSAMPSAANPSNTHAHNEVQHVGVYTHTSSLREPTRAAAAVATRSLPRRIAGRVP